MKIAIQSPRVQTWAVNLAGNYLSNELNCKVSVGAVDIRFFKTVELDQVYFADQKKDTVIYAPEINLSFSAFSIPKQRIIISEVELNKARIGLVRYASPRNYNIDFLIDYFSSSKKKKTKSKKWDLKIEDVLLTDNVISYRDVKYNESTTCINWDDVYCSKFNLHITDIVPDTNQTTFDIRQMSFVEKSGFVLNFFSSKVKLTDNFFDFKSLAFKTPNSDVLCDFNMKYERIEDFEDFINKVDCKGQIYDSKVSFKDLKYFSSELNDVEERVYISGSFRGRVNKFKAKNVHLKFTDDLYFRGNVTMTGLPDIDGTLMEIEAKDLCLNKRDVESLPQYPFNLKKNIVLPNNISLLGKVHFSGSFDGFYNDFVARGNTTTDIGQLFTDINFKVGNDDKNTVYSGQVGLTNFNVGKFWKLDPEVGVATLNVDVKGRGLEIKNVVADITGKVSLLQLHGYNYSGITLNGQFAKKLFNGEFIVADPNLEMDFQGDVNFSGDLPEMHFNSSITTAHLAKLKLVDRDISANLTTDIAINLVGNSIENTQGTISIDDLNYSEHDKSINVEQIEIESVINKQRVLKINSELFSCALNGQFNLDKVASATKVVFSNYIPTNTANQISKDVVQNLNFKIDLNQVQSILNLFYPQLKIADNTSIYGNLNSEAFQLSLNVKSDSLGYENISLHNFKLNGKTANENFQLQTNLDSVYVDDELMVGEVRLEGITRYDTASIRVQLAGENKKINNADFRFDTKFLPTGYTTLKVIPAQLLVNGSTWFLSSENYMLIDSSGILLSKFDFNAEDQFVGLSGILSSDSTAKLKVKFQNFETGNLNDILRLYDAQITGIANGVAEITSLLKKPIIDANLSVEKLCWFNDTLGDANIITEFDGNENVVAIRGDLTHGGDKNFLISGKYYLKEKDDELDFTVKVKKTRLQSFSHYVQDVFSGFSGIASGELKLKGTVSKPSLTGNLTLQKVNLTLDYLKTTYNLNTEVELLNNKIVFKDVTINDVKGNKAILNGEITHHYLKDWNFDLAFKANNFQILNTTSNDNEVYYGEAFASGSTTIKGGVDNLAFGIGLKSEKGTKIYIPLSNPEEVSKTGFVTFVDHSSTLKNNLKLDSVDFSGITLDMSLEATPDATIYLVFDSKIGDIIEGTGKGNLRMTVTPTEDLKMYGSYEIESGKYLFTMQNVLNKNFSIERGGYIRWNGDPYDANINISALYRPKVSLFDLFQDSTFKKNVPVILRLNLTDKLFNPNISFDINVLNVDPTVETQIKRLINTEEEKYRQAISLIVAKRFSTPSDLSEKGGVTSGAIVGSNAYELLTNQLSNWASQISDQFDVNVSYNPGDQVTNDQIEVGVQTSILNNRILIDVSGGTANSPTKGQNTTNIVGDFNVEYMASKDGRFKLKAFNRSNNNTLINNINSNYTQGVGVFYRQEFNSFSDLFRRKRQ
ncbi:MAG: translocation/assembly module TamB domain-containing protein [Bacteroidota bacterium]